MADIASKPEPAKATPKPAAPAKTEKATPEPVKPVVSGGEAGRLARMEEYYKRDGSFKNYYKTDEYKEYSKKFNKMVDDLKKRMKEQEEEVSEKEKHASAFYKQFKGLFAEKDKFSEDRGMLNAALAISKSDRNEIKALSDALVAEKQKMAEKIDTSGIKNFLWSLLLLNW